MADNERVSGAGWLSDDSSFYGDEDTVLEFMDRSKRVLKLASPRLRRVVKKRKIEAPVQDSNQHVDEPVSTASPAKTTSSAANDGGNVLDFLKSRPQVAKLQKDTLQARTPLFKDNPRTLAGEEASELVHSDRFEEESAAWQQTETIDEFLKRLPVTDPDTASVGPWLWVSCPHVRRDRRVPDVDAFVEKGDELLEAYDKQRAKIEERDPGKPAATYTRRMGPCRDQLEEDLLTAAVKTGTTCGKWMLFPGPEDLPRYWRVVAEATAQGTLGPTSKVATPDPYDGKIETLVCVYTYDFTDASDVGRVLAELLDLQLFRRDGKQIFYKCDAYTYLNIVSDNRWKLRASLYSSNELLKNETKSSKEGPVARLKKRNGKIDGFLSS